MYPQTTLKLKMSQKRVPAKIQFFYPYKKFFLPARKHLKNAIRGLFDKEKVELQQLDYIYCSDGYLLEINQGFLGHEDFTDIITFSYSAESAPVTGEIYISIDRVKENAALFGVSFQQELYRVIFHGALHLCGYKDKTNADTLKMRAKEEEYLKKYQAK